jgi:hypothetical protein
MGSASCVVAEPAGLDEAALACVDDELGAVAGAELEHRAADVGLGGVRADDELLGDLVVGEPGADEREDLTLAGGQFVQFGLPTWFFRAVA